MEWVIRKTVELRNPPQQSLDAPYLLMLPGDNKAHVWEITVLADGQPANLDGCIASAIFQRHDNTLVTCLGPNTAISGNVVRITFRPECYNVPGGMRGAVRLAKDSNRVTIADQAFVVQPDFEGEVVEDEYIPSLENLLSQVSRLEQANDIGLVLTAVSGLMAAHVDGEKLVINKIAVTDEGAYAAAVAAGYEGTEEEWDAFVAAVTGNQALITAADQKATQALSGLEDKATVSTATITLTASGWTGASSPYTQTVACAIATATNTLIVGIGGSITDAQKTAVDRANIVCTAQAAGSLTFTAFGVKPDVNLPVNVLGVN